MEILQWVQEGLVPRDKKEYSVKMQSINVLLFVIHISSTTMDMDTKAVKKVKTYKQKILKLSA